MNENDILEALGEAGEPFAEAAAPNAAKKRTVAWRRILSAAAALILITVAAVFLWRGHTPSPVETEKTPTDNTQASATDPAPVSETDPAPVNEPASTPADPQTAFTDLQVDPTVRSASLLSTPEYPERVLNPAVAPNGYEQEYHEKWYQLRNARFAASHSGQAGDAVTAFLSDAVRLLLADADTENAVVSPLNLYLALSMLADVTSGNTRDALLSLLHVDSVESLRALCNNLWNAHYLNDGATTLLLGSSIWLRKGFDYNLDTVSVLSNTYYASVFAGDMADPAYSAELRAWLSQMTGGLLDEYVSDVNMTDETIMELVTTVLYRVKWLDEFSAAVTEPGMFHAPGGDVSADFMKRTLMHGPYFWGEHFGAVELNLEDNGRMRLVLPDEGYTPADLLEDPEALSYLLARDAWIDNAGTPAGGYYEYEAAWQNVTRDKQVHLSLPKFTVSANLTLNGALSELGLADLFTPGASDFSPLFAATPVNEAIKATAYIGEVEHAATLSVDEEGVTAAAYTRMPLAGAAPPPEEEMDLVFDRPFLFVLISEDRQPLFIGVVNNP